LKRNFLLLISKEYVTIHRAALLISKALPIAPIARGVLYIVVYVAAPMRLGVDLVAIGWQMDFAALALIF
jgi:hypothetical protein